jgi:CSLREA domain-containing protein
MNPRLHLALICASLLLCARAGHSAVFNIPDGDVAALKNAITTANANGQADVINLAPNGTYTLTAADHLTDGATGLPKIDNDAAGLDLTINGHGATIQRSTVAGTPEFRIVHVNFGAALSCDSLTIANGALTGSFPNERGAGIILSQATLTLTNCTVRNHVAKVGGAIYSSQSAVTLNGSTITANRAERGGGIYSIDGSISGSGSTMSANEAYGTPTGAAAGGAIYSYAGIATSSVTLADCHFTANRVLGPQAQGGAILSARQNGTAIVVVTNSTFEGNFGEAAWGGALSNVGGSTSLTSCTLRDNYARSGGAVHSQGGSLEVRSSLLEQNTAFIDPATTAGGSGGGIYFGAGTLAVVDSTLRNNEAGYAGGAIFNFGTATINDSDFNENAANAQGGAIANSSSLTLADSRFDGNAGAPGGAIFNSADAVLKRCTLTRNEGTAGGGILNGGTLSLEGSTLDNNQAIGANGEGGAIGIATGSPAAKTSVRDSTLSHNRAARGGAISNIGSLTLLNSTLSGNAATAQGGALFNKDGSSFIGAATFYGNTAQNGGGIYNVKGTAETTVTVMSTILRAGATGANIVNVTGATFVSSGYNLSSDAAGGDTGTGPGGFLLNTDDIRNTDPNLGPLQNNGGPTKTHALLFPSAAIDSGNDFIQVLPFRVKTDQRGQGYPRQIGERVDKGAAESGVSLVVTTIDDHNDGFCTPGDCTLREAIIAVNAAKIGNISFAAGVTGTIQLANGLPELSAHLVLHGPGADLLTVRRNSGSEYRIFTINNGTTSGPRVTISGLTISNGVASEGPYPSNSGGGIFSERGVLTVSRCVISGNRAAGAGAYGGGIFNEEGTLIVRESTLTGNIAANGGGIASLQAYPGTASVWLEASTLHGNTAEQGDGGAIYNRGVNAGATANFSLMNCTLSGNSATPSGFFGGAGGAVYNAAASSGKAEVFLGDCTVSGNNAPNTGGIYNNNFGATARVSLVNTILKRGTAGGNFLNSSGEIVSHGHNISDDAAGGLGGSGPGGFLNGTGDMRETDALLGPLQNNGGPTATHALLGGSPAINAGEDTIPGQRDQRGYAKVGTNDIGAFEVGGVAPQPPAPLSIVSRKVHGSAGAFDIDLLATPAQTECRSGGAAGTYQLVLTFADEVSVTDLEVSSSDNQATATVSYNGPVLTIDLAQVANAQTIALHLVNVSDEARTGDIVIPFHVLLGDTNGNGSVTASDIGQTKGASGQPVTTANFRTDVNANGAINSTDISAVKSVSGTQLPAIAGGTRE